MKNHKKMKTMFDKIKNLIDNVYAHCDVPCGIYDPHNALISALTVLRMDDLIALLDKNAPDYDLKFVRYVNTKEDHAELCKHEIRIIWGDFFKPHVHGDNFNKADELAHKIMLLGSSARQTMDVQVAKDLVEAVNEFAEVFWTTKNVNTARLKAPFPVEAEMVVPSA